MLFDIQLSEQGTLSQIVRGVQMVLALDSVESAVVRFDFDNAPWRHFFSGPEQVRLRQITGDIRSPHVESKLRDADIKQLVITCASVIAQDAPTNTWLITTGGVISAANADLDRYLGHIEVGSKQDATSESRQSLCVPVGICQQVFGRQTPAQEGILVVGSGDPADDRAMLDYLAAVSKTQLTLFDVYVQHVKCPPAAQVRVAAPGAAAKRAALYATCQYVVSGNLQQQVDDHFVAEAAQVGCTVLRAPKDAHLQSCRWDADSVGAAWRKAQLPDASAREPEPKTMPLALQAQTIAQIILEPARLAAWSQNRWHQFCDAHGVDPSEAQVAWVHCGREALWDSACAQWLAQSKYKRIYVDTSQTPLVFTSIFSTLFTQQLTQPGRSMPHVHGSENALELRALVKAGMQITPNSRCDVVHLSCPLPQVLATRRHLQALDVQLTLAEHPHAPDSPTTPLPMIFVNQPRPGEPGGVSAKVIGAADAIENALRGIMYDAPERFRLSWLHRGGPRTPNGRIYYYPYEHHPLQHDDQLALAQLRHAIKAGAIDAIVVADARVVGVMEARQAWAQKSIPIVTLLHSLAAPRTRLDSVAQMMLCQALPSDLFVAPSTSVLEAFKKRLQATSDLLYAQTKQRFVFEAKMCVIPYGVDTSAFFGMHKSTCRQLLRLPSDRVILLHVNRFNRSESCDLLPLLVALQHVVQAGQTPLLVLAGHDYDYGYSAEVRANVSRLGLDGYVEIRKNVEARKKPYLYGASDVVISPDDNIHHTFCTPVLEAMAAGVAVIASAWASHTEVAVHDKTAILVPARWTQVRADLDIQAALLEPPNHGYHRDLHESIALDVERLAAAIQRLCEDAPLRRAMGEAGRRRCVEHYDIRQQSRLLSDAILSQIELAKLHPDQSAEHVSCDEQNSFFEQFSGYASDILDASTRVELTPLARDKTRLAALLAAANLGDEFELRKIDRLIEALDAGPSPVSALGDAAVDMLYILRGLKYGIFQVVT